MNSPIDAALHGPALAAGATNLGLRSSRKSDGADLLATKSSSADIPQERLSFPHEKFSIHRQSGNAKMTEKPPPTSQDEAATPSASAPPVHQAGADEDSDPDLDDLDGMPNSKISHHTIAC
jgi:hypothetical protein